MTTKKEYESDRMSMTMHGIIKIERVKTYLLHKDVYVSNIKFTTHNGNSFNMTLFANSKGALKVVNKEGDL